MLYWSFFVTVAFYGVLCATHIYEVQQDPSLITGTAIGLLHAVIGLCLAFFILYKGFYGLVLGGPCWLMYKVLEAALLAMRGLTSLLFTSQLLPQSPRDQDALRHRQVPQDGHDPGLPGVGGGVPGHFSVRPAGHLLDRHVV